MKDHVVAKLRVAHLLLELIEASFRDRIFYQAHLSFPSNIDIAAEVLLDCRNPEQQVHLA